MERIFRQPSEQQCQPVFLEEDSCFETDRKATKVTESFTGWMTLQSSLSTMNIVVIVIVAVVFVAVVVVAAAAVMGKTERDQCVT